MVMHHFVQCHACCPSADLLTRYTRSRFTLSLLSIFQFLFAFVYSWVLTTRGCDPREHLVLQIIDFACLNIASRASTVLASPRQHYDSHKTRKEEERLKQEEQVRSTNRGLEDDLVDLLHNPDEHATVDALHKCIAYVQCL